MKAASWLRGALLALAVCVSGGAGAQELRMGFASEWTGIDPHYHNFPQNLAIAHHMFDALVTTDKHLKVQPQLAESWRALGPQAWEFKLRRGVKFIDGSDFTAEDVAATLTRIPKITNSPGPLTTFIRPISGWEIPDPYTIILKTKEPAPTLPISLASIYIIPKRLADAATEQFTSGQAMIGTGPFKFIEWAKGDRLVLERNESYWGPKPEWKKVTIKVLTNTAAREAALLAGDVDFIQNPSTVSMEKLAQNPKIALHKAPSTRITYIQFHQGKDPLPDVKGTDGRNPFADPRVRRAFSIAIPRVSIAERIMDNLSLPAAQIVPPGSFGHNPALPVEKYDLEAAAKLLKEAGYPNGFEVSLATPNDRNINGVRIAQTMASSLSRIGVKVTVNATPLNVYINEWRKGAYSFYMHGWGPPVESMQPVLALTATKDMQNGLGVSNEAFYSNKQLDTVLQDALKEIDDRKREQLMFDAAKIIYDDTAVISLHYEVLVWASRKDLAFDARGDERTHAIDVRSAAK